MPWRHANWGCNLVKSASTTATFIPDETSLWENKHMQYGFF